MAQAVLVAGLVVPEARVERCSQVRSICGPLKHLPVRRRPVVGVAAVAVSVVDSGAVERDRSWLRVTI